MAGNYGIYGAYGMGTYGNNQPYNSGFQQPQVVQPQPQLRTNKVFVTSLEDALNRYAEPNTIMVYRHQDEKFEYEIMTDMQGKKTYKTLVLADYSTAEPRKDTNPANYLTIDAFDALQAKFDSLESKVESLEAELLKKTKRIEKSGGTE